MTIQSANHVHFGRLVLREKSLADQAELDKEKLQWYRMSRKRYRNAIDKLDRAGVDIEIRGERHVSDGEQYGSITSYVLDKQRNLLASTWHKADASPWDVVAGAIANGLQAIEFEKPAITDEPRYIPIAEVKNDKLVPTGEGATHRLSHRGRLVETGRFKIDA